MLSRPWFHPALTVGYAGVKGAQAMKSARWLGGWGRWSTLTLLAVLFLLAGWSAGGARAAAPLAAGPGQGASPAEAGSDLVFFNRKITTFRVPLLGVSPAERARRAEENLERILAREVPRDVDIRHDRAGIYLVTGGSQIFVLTEGDVDPLAGRTLEQAADEARGALETALSEVAESRDVKLLARGAGVVAGVTLLAVAGAWLLGRGRRAIRGFLLRLVQRHAARFQVAGAALLRWDRLAAALNLIISGAYWLTLVVLGLGWLSFVLERFPYTRTWGEELHAYFVDLLVGFILNAVGALPKLLVVVMIYFVARAVVLTLRPLFDRVASGRVSIGWLDRDTVGPTQRIATALVWIFALVMAYPYLPGAQTEAFKGVSVLIGLMISLGATSVVGQAAAGLILMYSRTIRPGEYVRIGEQEGTVVELGMFTTRVRSGMGEEISLPNAIVLGVPTRNYSRGNLGGGYVLDTAVSIGYDVPWRQVQAMLLEAARSTPGIVAEPPPRVFQTSLGDFYPVYRLVCQAQPSEPGSRAELTSRLHEHVQDVFNRYGVQIMSPHYLSDAPQPKVVPPERWYTAPAAPPP